LKACLSYSQTWTGHCWILRTTHMTLFVVLKSPDSVKLREKIRKARYLDLPGPAGWNRSILEMLGTHSAQFTGLEP
jgi:hypothetical protein